MNIDIEFLTQVINDWDPVGLLAGGAINGSGAAGIAIAKLLLLMEGVDKCRGTRTYNHSNPRTALLFSFYRCKFLSLGRDKNLHRFPIEDKNMHLLPRSGKTIKCVPVECLRLQALRFIMLIQPVMDLQTKHSLSSIPETKKL